MPKPRRLRRFSISDARFALFNIKRDSEYARLTSLYPKNVGMCRSHVDALLFVDDNEGAKLRLADYGLTPEQDEWNAIQLGRAELGLHNYKRAIELFTALRPRRPDNSYVVTYLARALQQNGDLVGAITVLEEGAGVFDGNVAILTSLGSNYERARRDDQAFGILAPLFAADASNARAALSLVRLYLRAKNSGAARTVLNRAEKHAPDSMRSFVVMAHAEVLIDGRNAAGAAEYLRTHAAGDEATAAPLIDALLAAAEDAGSSAGRLAFLDEAAAVPVPGRLGGNVPVQIVLARLAAARRDRVRFDEAIGNLAETRIDLAELESLKALWSEPPGTK